MDYEGKLKCTQNINVVGSMCYHFVCIVSHGLYDGIVMKCVWNFYDVVENDPKSRICSWISPYKMKYFFDKEILVVGESNELLDKKWSQNFVMTCSNVVYIILCANSKDVFWSKIKAKIWMTKKS